MFFEHVTMFLLPCINIILHRRLRYSSFILGRVPADYSRGAHMTYGFRDNLCQNGSYRAKLVKIEMLSIMKIK